MPRQLRRFQDNGDYHFVTFSCYDRRPYLAEHGAYDVFEEILERFRARNGLHLYAYVLMPEHVHLLLSEPLCAKLSSVLGVIKQQSSKRLIQGRPAFWLERYHDVNLATAEKTRDAVRYIHRNPVARGLVERPEDWPWSSYRHYLTGTPGRVEVESWWTEMARKRISDLPPRETG
jgi:putative transposase